MSIKPSKVKEFIDISIDFNKTVSGVAYLNKCVWTLAKNALRQMCTNIIDDIEYMRKDKSFVEESIYPMKLTEKEKIIYKQGIRS